LRHGLAATKHLNPRLPQNIERMAKAMCGDDTVPLLFEQAHATRLFLAPSA